MTTQNSNKRRPDRSIDWRKLMRKWSVVRWIKNASPGTLLLSIFVVSVVLGGIWLLIGPLLVEVETMNSNQWSGFEAITTAAAFVFGIGAGIILLVELSQNTDARNLDIYRDIYEKFMADDQIEARRYLYTELPDTTDGEELLRFVNDNPEAKKAVKDTLNIIDYFGFLAEQDWVTADEMIGWVSPIVVKVWLRIGPLVDYECAKRSNSEPDYYASARELVRRCKLWRERNLPRDLQDATMDKTSL